MGTIEEKEQKKLEKEQRKAEKEQKKLEKKMKKKGSSLDLGSQNQLQQSQSTFGAASSNDLFAKMGSKKNLDPGVQSDEDEDEDDMLKFDAISHKGSGSSLAINKASSDALYRQSFGTPVNPRYLLFYHKV